MVRRKDAPKKICSYRLFGRYGFFKRGQNRLKKEKKIECVQLTEEEQRYVTITLRDVEELDGKHLNVIPSSIEESGDSPWIAMKDGLNGPGKLFSSTKCSFPETNETHCPVCTAQLLGLEGNGMLKGDCKHSSIDSSDDDLIVKAKKIIEQNVLSFLSGLANDEPPTEELPERKTRQRGPTIQEESDESYHTHAALGTVGSRMQASLPDKLKGHQQSPKLGNKVNSEKSNNTLSPPKKFEDYANCRKTEEKTFEDYVRRIVSTTEPTHGINRQREYRRLPVMRDNRRPPVMRDNCRPPVMRDNCRPPVMRDNRRPPVMRDREINCSMSKVSMHAYMCPSKSELTAATAFVSQAVQTPEVTKRQSMYRQASSAFLDIQSTSSQDNHLSEYSRMAKLKDVCGQMLLEMCSLRDQEFDVNGFTSKSGPTKTKTSKPTLNPFYHFNAPKGQYQTDFTTEKETLLHQGDVAATLRDELPIDWFQGLHWEKPMRRELTVKHQYQSSNSPPLNLHQQTLLIKQVHETKNKAFRPLLCTKLSIPWVLEQTSTTSYYENHQIPNESVHEGKGKVFQTKSPIDIVKSVSSKVQASKSRNAPSRSAESHGLKSASKKVSLVLPIKEQKRANHEEDCKIEVLCDRCKSPGQGGDLRDSSKRSFTARHAAYRPKTRKIYRPRSRRKRTVRKRRVMSGRSRSRRSQHHSRHRRSGRRSYPLKPPNDVKMFMKSFFTASSEETLDRRRMRQKKSRPQSPRAVRSPRRTRVRSPKQRRRSAGQSARKVTGRAQKMRRNLAHLRNILAEQGRLGGLKPFDDALSKNPTNIKSTELAMINKHIKAFADKHMKRERTPLFHAALRRMIPTEEALPPPPHRRRKRRKSIRTRATAAEPRRSTRRGHHKGAGLRSLEKRNFNESLFSCLIPRVFK